MRLHLQHAPVQVTMNIHSGIEKWLLLFKEPL